MKAKFDTGLKFLRIALFMKVFDDRWESIAYFSFSGMWEADKDKFMILVMTRNSGPMHSFSSNISIGYNEHVFEADSWTNFLTSC